MILKPNMPAIPTLGTWRAGSPGPKTAPAKPLAFGKPSGPLFTIYMRNKAEYGRLAPVRKIMAATTPENCLSARAYADALLGAARRTEGNPGQWGILLPER